MQTLRCVRFLARPISSTPTRALLRPSLASTALPTTRTFSLLSPRRPQLSASPLTSTSATSTTLPIAADGAVLDLLPKISAHPALAGVQVRCGPRDTFSPSHRVRKRRHGFLARLRSRGGRKILMRRKLKGRVALTH